MAEAVTADLSGRTCLVTGANSGIGKEVARGLARLGAHVVMACRSRERGEEARSEIARETGNARLELVVVDLASQASIRDLAGAFSAAQPALHVLVNNAGIWSQTRHEGPDGIEATWATNVLGYFLLTRLLLPALERGAPSRIVNVASEAAGGLDLSDVEFKRRRYNGARAYAQSKQADRMLTWALARRLDGTRVTSSAVHPGGVSTDLFRKAGGIVGAAATVYARLFTKAPAEGADTVLWLAASPELEGVDGKFWVDRQERRCRFRDARGEDALWALCESMTGGAAGVAAGAASR